MKIAKKIQIEPGLSFVVTTPEKNSNDLFEKDHLCGVCSSLQQFAESCCKQNNHITKPVPFFRNKKRFENYVCSKTKKAHSMKKRDW
ncbi:hypothetical protein [Methanolacinia paynteri]|uniref:hypothetical protein n=1 Tax=Methanolacinia paynteri TaxID=230356 RepID=UPI00064E82D1|nr:hypothetical protein [Methanolacinia paynteri]